MKSAKELSIAMPTGVLVQFTDEEPKYKPLQPSTPYTSDFLGGKNTPPTADFDPKLLQTLREKRCTPTPRDRCPKRSRCPATATHRLQMWSTMTLPARSTPGAAWVGSASFGVFLDPKSMWNNSLFAGVGAMSLPTLGVLIGSRVFLPCWHIREIQLQKGYC